LAIFAVAHALQRRSPMKNNRRFPRPLLGLTLALGVAPGCLASPASPASDRQQQLGIVCEAQVKIAGHFETSAARPADVFGCWPVGTWTFSASVESSDCASPPALAPQYAFAVARDADSIETYRYLGATSSEGIALKVSSGGSGLCEGGLMIYSADRKTLVNLKPTLHADGTITGNGEVELYATPQF
jgi:hypothetical protein